MLRLRLSVNLKREDRIESIYSRCHKGESITQRPAKAVASSPSAGIQAPTPAVSKEQIRLALEKTLKGSFDRKIDGTLGAIFVFRRPPGTIPERIAVKTVFPDSVKSHAPHDAVVRLMYEVRHWIEYRHSPLILHPFFTELVYGWPYVVMPYCNCTLRDYIDQKAPRRGQAEAIALMVQCVAALEYARQHGLLAHQDLKPENILLRSLTNVLP
jgi:serine/threonine protein kinase